MGTNISRRAALTGLGALVASGAQSKPYLAGPRYGHVYLITGLANIFSVGMDVLGDELTARGVPNSVRNHLFASADAGPIVADYRGGRVSQPIAIAGHSFGADAAVGLAEQLQAAGVPVRLLVLFDATAARIVPANVAEAINFYIAPGGTGGPIGGGPGFKGRIQNRNLAGTQGIIHTTIDKFAPLHKVVIAEVLRTLRR